MRLTTLAQEAGLAAPHTEVASDAAVAAWEGPVVVKCRSHWVPSRLAVHRIEAKLSEGIDAARPQLEVIRAAGEQPVLQPRWREAWGRSSACSMTGA